VLVKRGIPNPGGLGRLLGRSPQSYDYKEREYAFARFDISAGMYDHMKLAVDKNLIHHVVLMCRFTTSLSLEYKAALCLLRS